MRVLAARPARLVIAEQQQVTFECEVSDPLRSDQTARAVIRADLFGTDEVFQHEVTLVR